MKPFTRPKSTQLEQTFDRYYPSVFRFFRYRGADADTANDLAASVFERALIAIHQYDPRKAQIQTWLFAIARNLYLKGLRNVKRQTDLTPHHPDPKPALEQQVESRLQLAAAMSAIQSLSEVDRTAFLMRVQHELPYEEIARALQLPLATIKVKIHRARLKLAALEIGETE